MIGPEDLPSVNACLNASSALLLVGGYAAIKQRHWRLHAVCMVLAFVVSSLFLVSYLYYHFVVRGGRPTVFQGHGWIRPAYFAVLLSHTILAVVVLPLALVTFGRALFRQFARHARLGRWTFPVWLYVSVTGVLVYWMLYHLAVAT